jgi:hypothetical protein
MGPGRRLRESRANRVVAEKQRLKACGERGIYGTHKCVP